jgi:hypothetical protein
MQALFAIIMLVVWFGLTKSINALLFMALFTAGVFIFNAVSNRRG